jgi:hypothetical protein
MLRVREGHPEQRRSAICHGRGHGRARQPHAQLSAPVARRAEPGPFGDPAESSDRRDIADPLSSLLVLGPKGGRESINATCETVGNLPSFWDGGQAVNLNPNDSVRGAHRPARRAPVLSYFTTPVPQRRLGSGTPSGQISSDCVLGLRQIASEAMMLPSPVRFTTRPGYTAIVGSIRSHRQACCIRLRPKQVALSVVYYHAYLNSFGEESQRWGTRGDWTGLSSSGTAEPSGFTGFPRMRRLAAVATLCCRRSSPPILPNCARISRMDATGPASCAMFARMAARSL